MPCPNCHAANKAYAAFCIECGEPLMVDEGAPIEERSSASVATRFAPRLPTLADLRKLFARRPAEVIVGAVLLLVVLAAGIGDAWRQQKLSNAYRDGKLAEQAKHWDEAARLFDEAEDLHDAAVHATNARTNIARRDGYYQAGLKAAALSDWARARALFAQAAEIQPDYADIAAELASARAAQIGANLNGLFYLTDAPGEAGIYRKAPSGSADTFLPGSDAASQLLLLGPEGSAAVYSSSASSKLYLATFDPASGALLASRALSGQIKPGGSGIAATGGFWWRTSATALYYVEYSNGFVHSVNVPPDWQVFDYDRRNGRLLLGYASVSANRRYTRLVLADALGLDSRNLFRVQATIRQASISPDGQWLIYLQEQPGAAGTFRYPGIGVGRVGNDTLLDGPGRVTISLMALRLDNAPGFDSKLLPGRVLDSLVLPADIPTHSTISASFSPSASAAYVVADRRDEYGRHLTVYDLARRVQTRLEPATSTTISPRYSPLGDWMLLQSNDADAVRVVAQPLDTLRPAQDVLVPISGEQQATTWISTGEDYILYLVQEPRIGRGIQTYSLYSLPLDGGAATPINLFRELFNLRSARRQLTLALAPGGRMLAYIGPSGELRAVSADGSDSVNIAGSVRRVWSP